MIERVGVLSYYKSMLAGKQHLQADVCGGVACNTVKTNFHIANNRPHLLKYQSSLITFPRLFIYTSFP